MKEKINKANNWLLQNLIWIVLCFAFWISTLVFLVSFEIWLGNKQRTEITKKTANINYENQKNLKQAKELRELIKK